MTVTLFIKHDYKNSSPYFKPELYATLDYAVQYCLINKMQGHLYNKPKKLAPHLFGNPLHLPDPTGLYSHPISWCPSVSPIVNYTG